MQGSEESDRYAAVLVALHLLISAPFPMFTTTPSEIWNDILKGNVGKDHPLWKLYLDKAAVFDTRMVDEWNKIVDVLLVYVGYFLLPSQISCLSSNRS
jgi:Family of unknown function (DUF6535)